MWARLDIASTNTESSSKSVFITDPDTCIDIMKVLHTKRVDGMDQTLKRSQATIKNCKVKEATVKGKNSQLSSSNVNDKEDRENAQYML